MNKLVIERDLKKSAMMVFNKNMEICALCINSKLSKSCIDCRSSHNQFRFVDSKSKKERLNA